MRFELRVPDGDHAQDAFIASLINGAYAFAALDTNVDLGALSLDDAALPAWTAVLVALARSAYDGNARAPAMYDALARSLRREGKPLGHDTSSG